MTGFFIFFNPYSVDVFICSSPLTDYKFCLQEKVQFVYFRLISPSSRFISDIYMFYLGDFKLYTPVITLQHHSEKGCY